MTTRPMPKHTARSGRSPLLGGIFTPISAATPQHLKTDTPLHAGSWCRCPFTAIAMASTIAGRIEIFTLLVCSVYKPDTFKRNYSGVDASWIDLSAPNLAAASPSPTLIPIYLAGLIMEPLKTGDKTTLSNQCASDPVVQAEVAKLAAGKPYYCYLQSMRVHRAYVALSIIVRPLTKLSQLSLPPTVF